MTALLVRPVQQVVRAKEDAAAYADDAREVTPFDHRVNRATGGAQQCRRFVDREQERKGITATTQNSLIRHALSLRDLGNVHEAMRVSSGSIVDCRAARKPFVKRLEKCWRLPFFAVHSFNNVKGSRLSPILHSGPCEISSS